MSSSDPQERAITGALRAAIRDHGPITPEHVGSAAKRVLGNLRNAGPLRARGPLAPGETRETTMPVLLCRCARCAHEWAAWSRTIGAQPERPDRCPQCDTRTWDQRVARKAGRPKKAAEGARKTA